MLICSDGAEVDNRTGRTERTTLDGATVRACLSGKLFARGQACAPLSSGQLYQVFGEARIEYGRKLQRVGQRLRDPRVVEALREAGQRELFAAARFEVPEEQLAAAAIAVTAGTRGRARASE